MKKRLTSWLLTLAMLLSLVPAMGVTASAADTGSGTADDPYVVTTYEELQTAMQKAGGGYVRLGADIDTTSMNGDMGIGFKGQIVVNSNVALDLYSHKVTLMKRGDTERSGLIDVRRGSLTIEDSEGGGELNGKNMLTSKRLYLIECYDGAKVTVNSGKLSMWSAATAQTANAVIKNSGTVEINGGTLAISNEKNYDEVDMYLAQQDCALSMTSLDGSSVVINGGTFDGRVLLYAHAKSAGKAGSVINGGTFEKSVYVQKDRTKTDNVALDVSIRGGTYRYTPGYRTNDEGNQVSDPQDMFQFATLGFWDADRPYYDVAPYFHGADPEDGRLDTYDLTAFRSIFPTNAILVAKGQSYTHRDYRDGSETEVQLVDKLFTGADGNTEWARLMNSEYQTIDVVSDIQLEDATLKVGDTTVPDNGGNVTTGDKAITITGKVNKQIAQLVKDKKIDLGFTLIVMKNPDKGKKVYLDTNAATLSTASNSDGRLNITVNLPSAQLVKADYSVRLDLFPKQPGTTTTTGGEGLLPSGWKLSADSANKPVTINYNNNGGSGTMASQQVMSGKQPYTLPDCTFTAPAAGQVFKGWSTTQDGTGLLSDGKLPLTEVGSSVTVYAIWGVPSEMEINKVTLSVKTYSQRQSTDDFRVVDRTPYSEMSVRGFWTREGLNKKDGDLAGTYDKTKDYSVVYEFTATLGYQFAENISVDDVSANDGEVWQVQLFNDNKTLQVCVNYRSGDSIKGMWLKVKEPLAGDSARDDAYKIRSTDGRYTVEYTNWYQGEFTNNGQISGAPFSGNFAAGEKYTCAFRVLPSSGYKVAHGYTNGLYLNGAQVTNCTELNPTGDDAKGYYGLYTFTVMDTSDKISKVGIQVKPAADRADISTDFGPQRFTPTSRMELRTYQIYEGLNQTGGERPTAYDPAKDYSAIYEFTTSGSYSFADGISTADVTINDGHVWKVTRLNDGKNLLVYVNFPAASAAGQVVKTVTIQVKPEAERNTLNDFLCQSYTPDGMGNPACIVREGLNTDGTGSTPDAYDKNTDYSVIYQFPINPGCTIAADISTADVTINDGQVWKVSGDSKGENLLVYVNFLSSSNPNRVKEVSMTMNSKGSFKTIEDLKCQSFTPDDKLELVNQMFFAGLKDTANEHQIEDLTTAYQPAADYTVCYVFKLKPGFSFAQDITDLAKKHVTISEGEIYSMDTMENTDGAMLLRVFVSFEGTGSSSSTIKKVTLNTPTRSEIDQGASALGFMPTSYTPSDKMTYGLKVMVGLDQDDTGPALESGKFDAKQDYSVLYNLQPKDGFAFAEGFSTKDVTVTNGTVYKVEMSGKNCYVYVNFPAVGTPASQEVSNVHLNFKPVGLRHQIVDMSPVNWTPGAGTLKLYNVCYYEGENTDADTNKLTNIEAAYDPSKAYSVSFQLIGETGVVFAEGFDASSITLSDGKVWKVQRIGSDKNNVVICVTFPASGDTATKINAINLTIKPQEQRHALADFAPTASTPEGMSVTSTDIYKDGKLYTGSYDANTAYRVGYSLNTKSGYAFADCFTKENVTVSNGTVQSVNVINNNYVIVYVDFPVTGPTPETKTIEKINLDFKPYSGRSKISDLTPAYTPGTDMMQLGTTVFYEGDTIGSTLLDGNAAYDSTKNYTATFQFDVKTGVAIAAGFAQKDVSVSNGTIKNVVVNANSIVITVNFPKDPTTDPNYVTEAAVQVAAPVAGEHPKGPVYLTVTSGNADKFETALMFWFDMNDSDTFEVGKEYTANVYLKPKAGVTLADDMKLKINGKDAKLVKTDDSDGSVQFQLKIAAVDSSTPAPTDYTVTVTSGGNGSVSADHATAAAGTEITLTATPNSGYHFKEWQVIKGGSVTITNNKFNMPADNVEVKAIFEKNSSTGGGGGGGVTTYPITVKSAKNGDVTASHKSASKGTTVTLTVDPDKGYVLDTLTVLDGKDKEIKLTEKNGKYTFTMPASKVTVEAMFKASAPTGKNPFVDVPAGSYYEDAVIWAVGKGITTGTSATTFNPNGICTRAQAVTFLWRAAGSPAPKTKVMPFADVKAGSYYYDAVLWAVEKGITKGTSDTMFSPDATCTRAQIVTFLWRANGSPAVSGNSAFTDVAADAYYAAAVKWAEKNDVTGGIGGGLFGSNNNCTRAQIVTFIYRSVK
ncbi:MULTISPECIES: InlB B-repeat-containing protein [Eubacteriales]|uniref:InlB B-repeat-containing protein n=1 Tax=Eubacteriales TaxID=186802 RepID=UPI00242D0212|nr:MULTISPECIES: S-layer homology domain-containing protein [Eubacteriales]MCI6015379.1 S-layer homology domain-containing protein [Dysosmobacter sp.]MCI6363738.1 S-layer homology domain-containing protein [Intestinimonas butyriciproducens]